MNPTNLPCQRQAVKPGHNNITHNEVYGSAVFLAHALNARCRLIKDVDGVYESDPSCAETHPRRFAQLDYADALRVAGRLIQPKAVAYLSQHGICAEVAALARSYESTVHAGPTQLALAQE